jgi:thiosulfate reductase cytochrome b subunit
MADSIPVGDVATSALGSGQAVPGLRARHSATVRLTHWITALCFMALLISGVEIVISHPRFYWGEEGNINTPALFTIPIPASRKSVPTGYGYVLPDQNGWSRSLHFQSAWLVVATGVVYVLSGLLSGHFRTKLLPARTELSPKVLAKVVVSHLSIGNDDSYNPVQRIVYLFVIFGAFPLMIWTGLAMSPAVTSAWPFLVDSLCGHQSARTIHFFDTLCLMLFLLVHLLMVYRAGFRKRTGAMIRGR